MEEPAEGQVVGLPRDDWRLLRNSSSSVVSLVGDCEMDDAGALDGLVTGKQQQKSRIACVALACVAWSQTCRRSPWPHGPVRKRPSSSAVQSAQLQGRRLLRSERTTGPAGVGWPRWMSGTSWRWGTCGRRRRAPDVRSGGHK